MCSKKSLSVSLSLCPHFFLSFCISVSLHLNPTVILLPSYCLSVFLLLSFCLSFCVCIFFFLSLFQSSHQTKVVSGQRFHNESTFWSFDPGKTSFIGNVCLSVFSACIFLSLCLSVSLSLSLYKSFCLAKTLSPD
jgi:hypothetical protein